MSKLSIIPTTRGEVSAYIARPKDSCRGGVLVIHEVWGLSDHIKDVADRFAREGYLALAPDLLSDTIDIASISGLQEDLFNPKKRNAAQPILRKKMAPILNPSFAASTLAKLEDVFSYLHDIPEVEGRIASIGFCFGGTYSFGLAVNESRLKLAVPFYGHADYSVQELAKIKCPVRAFYGEKDEGLVTGLPELEEKMQEVGIDFEAKVYPNCGHAFFNDTNKFAYNQTAAKDAWHRVLGELKTYIG